ncbi:ATP-binding protein [Prosthecobacter sp.]|uniref:ATP-binding protein n=1 Tax=Prosthecobacter sp. TaxID=1965333 RepID=UPI003783E6A5
MKLTSTLSLPSDVCTRTLAILAQKGAGKTYTAMKLTELMLEAGSQVVALDPTGVWWGLRADADGKPGRGLDLIIMGGEHGDVPLASTAGEIIADFVVESGRSVVLDLSHFESNAAQDRFVTSFAEKLYRLKAQQRTPLHLMLDEADSFAPQRPQNGQQRMLGAFEAIVRRGRSRGLGMTMISQRPACLNKNVLTQADALICHRVTGKQDMDALNDWVKHWHGEKDQSTTFLQSLPALKIGECWFWSPGWTGSFVRSHVLKRTTFDSSKTPEPGAAHHKTTASLKPVDLGALTSQIQATVERAKANDPAELKRTIVRLEQELRMAQAERKPEFLPVLNNEDRQILQKLHDFFTTGEIRAVLAKVYARLELIPSGAPTYEEVTTTTGGIVVRMPQVPVFQVSHVFKKSTDGEKLAKCERAILTVLAQHSQPCSKRKVACIARYAIDGGGFNNSLSSLRTRGLLTGTDPLTITDDGRAALGQFTPLPTGLQAIEHWIRQLSKCEAAILTRLLEVEGFACSKQELAERAGYEATGGGFNNALSALRTRELIEGREIITLLIP